MPVATAAVELQKADLDTVRKAFDDAIEEVGVTLSTQVFRSWYWLANSSDSTDDSRPA